MGADRIPDKFFENIPGGYFTPPEKKAAKKGSRRQSEQPDRQRRRSPRERTSPPRYSDYSEYDDTDYEQERRRRDRRRRAKSVGRSPSDVDTRSSSRGRNRERNREMDQERFTMDDTERIPRFPPPPSSEYRPYDPRDYAPSSAPPVAPPPATTTAAYQDPYARQPSATRPDYGYAPQVNTTFRSRSATAPSERPSSLPAHMLRARKMSGPPLQPSTPLSLTPYASQFDALRSGTPLNATFSPSYEPPLAALLSPTATNPLQPSSATAARYTPGSGYTPSPTPGSAPIPPPNPVYPPYVPAEYVPAGPVQRAASNAYPSPPPFYRQQSRSQPSVAQYAYPDSQTQVAAYDPPVRHGSSASSSRHHRRGEGKHHRARSADQHARSLSRVTDKVRDRLENLDMHDKNLAASVGGALAGGLVGSKMGHGTLSTLIGAGIGAFGGREFEKRHEM